MSNLRQRRKPTTEASDDAGGDGNEDGTSSPSSASSWEKNFDNNGESHSDEDDNGNDETTKSKLTKEVVPAAPTPTALDKFLSTYGSFTASTFTADQGFKILQWSSWAISYATSSSPKYKHGLSPSLRKLYSELSMTRYVLRLVNWIFATFSTSAQNCHNFLFL